MTPVLPILLACAEEPGTSRSSGTTALSALQVDLVEEIPTVAHVRFTGAADGAATVEFACEGQDPLTTTAAEEAPGAWHALVVGMPPDRDCTLVATLDGEQSAVATVTTGSAPAWIPAVQELEGDFTPGFLLVGIVSMSGEGGGPVIFTTRGEPVWWWEQPTDTVSTLVIRARLSPDGRSVLFNHSPLVSAPDDWADSDGAIYQVGLDGTGLVGVAHPNNHHDFLVHDDGSMAWLDFEERQVDGLTLRGGLLKTRDVDGSEDVLWSAWDTFEYDPQTSYVEPETWWTMLNHLVYLPEEDAYLVSARNLDTIIEIDRSTGDITWVLGQEEATIVPDDPFDGQHGMVPLEGGLLLFDNQATAQRSRVVEYEVDPDAGEARRVWSYQPDSPRNSVVLGDVIRLAGGNTLTLWGFVPVIEEITPAAVVQGSLRFESGKFLGFADYYPQIIP